MRPNVITLLIGLIATLFIWWTQTAQRWAAWIWVAIAVCAVLLAVAVLWPRITRSRNLEQEAHELELYNADPAIQAFTRARAERIAAGVEPHDAQLGTLVMLLIMQTEWGRWQAGQHNVPFPVQPPVTPANRQFISIAASHLLTQLEQGLLAARGFYNANPNDVRFISPDWWGRVYFEVVDDPASILRARIRPRHNVDPAVCERFTAISCELPRFFALFPRDEPRPA